MYDLSRKYRPITAQPFSNDYSYFEIPPCNELKPYICCFWGKLKESQLNILPHQKKILVIPDTCMDIIFNIDEDNRSFNTTFVGINDTTFFDIPSNEMPQMTCFAIRFYAWAVPLFSDESMKLSLNSFSDVESYFYGFKKHFKNVFTATLSLTERILITDQYLLNKINLDRQNHNVLNSIYKMLQSKGNTNISKLSGYTNVSQRQLERLFCEYIGVSPKKLSSLIRYQFLWQDILFDRNYNIQDCVCKYGYTDQSHLLNDFKKYHTLSPIDARMFAYETR